MRNGLVADDTSRKDRQTDRRLHIRYLLFRTGCLDNSSSWKRYSARSAVLFSGIYSRAALQRS